MLAFAAVLADVASIALDLVGIAVVGTIAIAFWWGANQIEPHRIGRDGSWFTCRARQISIEPNRRGATAGRWIEARVFFSGDGVNVRFRKRSMAATSGPLAKAGDEGRRIRVYALSSNPLVEFRVPKRSRVVPRLDALVR